MHGQAAVVLGYVGASLGVVMVVPQVVRILRHPGLPGVSHTSWGLTALACFAWLTYGVRTAALPQVPGNVLLVLGAVCVVLLAPAEISRRRRGVVLGALAAVLLAIGLALPASAVGYLAFGIGLFSAWPQVARSFLTWRTGARSGVSVSTWALRIGSQACWLMYALGMADVPVACSALVALSTGMTLVGLETSARSRAVASRG